ncbi:hypothetical protein BDW68DRAFT_165433 [Aspergillus falconensis]
MTLTQLLTLSSKLQVSTSVRRGRRLCYGCQTRTRIAHRCPQCQMVFFCSRVCAPVLAATYIVSAMAHSSLGSGNTLSISCRRSCIRARSGSW